jgi:hypothetical protein
VRRSHRRHRDVAGLPAKDSRGSARAVTHVGGVDVLALALPCASCWRSW